MKTDLKHELSLAQMNGYAVPAFNFDNLIMLKAIIAAAESAQSPVILMVSEKSIRYLGKEYALNIAKTARQLATVPVVVHLDHATDLALAQYFIENGADSIMLDYSNKPLADNIAGTQKITKIAHAYNVMVEGEIGHVGGKEGELESQKSNFTSPQEAQIFVDETKVDALAIAVGSSHGFYKGKIELQYALIEKIRNSVSTPLVLHGSSGIPDKDLIAAIKGGITKINIGTEIKTANAKALRAWFKDNPTGYDARKFGACAMQAMEKVVLEKIKLCGSFNRFAAQT